MSTYLRIFLPEVAATGVATISSSIRSLLAIFLLSVSWIYSLGDLYSLLSQFYVTILVTLGGRGLLYLRNFTRNDKTSVCHCLSDLWSKSLSDCNGSWHIANENYCYCVTGVVKGGNSVITFNCDTVSSRPHQIFCHSCPIVATSSEGTGSFPPACYPWDFWLETLQIHFSKFRF
jgi:hypothetical protein